MFSVSVSKQNFYKVHHEHDRADHICMVLFVFNFEQTWKLKDVAVVIVFI